MRILSLLLCAVVAAVLSPVGACAASPSPAPSPSASPAVPAPPDSVSDLSLKLIAAFTAGKLDRSMFSANFNQTVGDDAVAQISPQLVALGKLQTITYAKGLATTEYPIYVYLVKYDKATVREIIGIDKTGKVDTWAMKP